MYIKYSLEEEGEIITDGSKTLARLQLKTEKLVKYRYELEFFSGKQFTVKPHGRGNARQLQVFSERKEQIGLISQTNGLVQLEMYDKLVLGQKYTFEKSSGWNRKMLIRNQSGTVVAFLMRKFLWTKLRNRLFIVEQDLDKLVFEDRMLIYALACVSGKMLR